MLLHVQFLDKARQKAREKKLAEKAAEMLQKQDKKEGSKHEQQKRSQPEVKRVPPLSPLQFDAPIMSQAHLMPNHVSSKAESHLFKIHVFAIACSLVA